MEELLKELERGATVLHRSILPPLTLILERGQSSRVSIYR